MSSKQKVTTVLGFVSITQCTTISLMLLCISIDISAGERSINILNKYGFNETKNKNALLGKTNQKVSDCILIDSSLTHSLDKCIVMENLGSYSGKYNYIMCTAPNEDSEYTIFNNRKDCQDELIAMKSIFSKNHAGKFGFNTKKSGCELITNDTVKEFTACVSSRSIKSSTGKGFFKCVTKSNEKYIIFNKKSDCDLSVKSCEITTTNMACQ